ncbi:MAG: TIM barrel protein [Acidobacteriota bacterium]|nr:TIM barrel protein [Acidobacteriota bacterium]
MAARESTPYGITLLLQNHHDLACHHEQFAWLLEEVNEPNLKAAFDAWAPHLQGISGEDLIGAVKRLAPWLAFTTVADYVAQPRFRYDPERVNYVPEQPPLVRAVSPGKGQVNYKSFFRGLKAIGYRGPVAYEMCAVLQGGGSIDNLDRTARGFRDFLRGMME